MNIEEAAKAAGASVYKNRHYLERPFYTFNPNQLERFAKIIRNQALEDAAVMCNQSDEDGKGPDCWGWHAKDFAAAIRAMKEQT